MAADPTLTRLEQHAFLDYHRDGVLDLVVGLTALAFGLGMWAGNSTVAALAWLPTLFYRPLRTRLVVPRLGFARFGEGAPGPARTARRSVRLLLLGSVLLGLVVFLATGWLPGWRNWLRAHPALLFTGLAAVGFVLAGLLTSIRRFLVYGAAAAVLATAGDLLRWQPEWPVTATATVVLLSGLVLLGRFLARHPALPDQTNAPS